MNLTYALVSFRLFFLFFLIVSPLHGEIQEITLRWDSKNCSENCQMLLDKGLRRVSGVADLVIDGKEGVASLRWKPLAKLRFNDIILPLRSSNVHLTEIHVTVRGTVSRTGNKFSLNSIGDDTHFLLLGSLERKSPYPISSKNPDAYLVDPSTEKRLIESMLGYELITISGTILLPERSPPFYLVFDGLDNGQQNPPPYQHPTSTQNHYVHPNGEPRTRIPSGEDERTSGYGNPGVMNPSP